MGKVNLLGSPFVKKVHFRINRLFMYVIKKLYRPYLSLIHKISKKRLVNNRFIVESYYGKNLIVYINPSKISYYLPVMEVSQHFCNKKLGKKFVCDGEWEKILRLIKDHRKTKDMFELYEAYENQQSYKSTKAYTIHRDELVKNKLNSQNEPSREVLDSITKIKRYYEKNIALYKRIKYEGYSHQDELSEDTTKEIGIAVGRSGEIYRYGNGYHRMAVAKFLKLKKVPVIIKLIHREWYDYCCNKHRCEPIDAVKKEIEIINNIY